MNKEKENKDEMRKGRDIRLAFTRVLVALGVIAEWDWWLLDDWEDGE